MDDHRELLAGFEPEVCYFHFPCHDGSLAAATVRTRFPAVVLRRASYHSTPDFGDLAGKRVLLVDVALSDRQAAALDAVGADWRLLDHHGSALSLKARPNCVVDTSRCGSVLAFEALFPDRPVRPIYRMIDAYDRWTGTEPDAHKIVAAMSSYGHKSIEPWEEWVVNGDSALRQLLLEGTAILRSAEARAAFVDRDPILAPFGGFADIPIINIGCDYDVINPLGEKLARKRPFAVFWRQTGVNEFILSLRSCYGYDYAPPNAVPVSLVAACFGGGGHAASAGMTWMTDPFAQSVSYGPVRGGLFRVASELWGSICAEADRETALNRVLSELRATVPAYVGR